MKKVLLSGFAFALTVSLQAQSLVTTDNLNVVREKHQTVLMDNGNVLAFGGDDGYTSSLVYYTSAEIYNTTTNSWSTTGSMAGERNNFASALLPNGKVLAIGGRSSSTIGIATCEIYDPGTGTWSAAADMNEARWGHKAVTLQNGKILVAGGDDDDGYSAEIYDPALDTWTLTAVKQHLHGQYASMVVLDDGRVLISGGWFSSPDGTIAEIYDPALDTWTIVGNMNEDRDFNHSSVVLENGKVLVIGGTLSGSADIYDPATTTWTATGAPLAAKNHGVAFRLNDGKVFAFSKGNLFGGTAGSSCFEIYDPASGTWSGPVQTIYGASSCGGVVLDNGQILIVGGNFTTGNGASDVCYLVNGVVAGVENQTIVTNLDFKMYPNPANDMITIENINSQNNADLTIQILDVSGRVILTDKLVQSNKLNINLNQFESGVYFCKSISSAGESQVKQFVIQ